MVGTGQPYLRAMELEPSGMWRTALTHIPLYAAGALIIWTLGILNRFSGAQSISAPGLRQVTPAISFAVWAALLIYTAFWLLAIIRPGGSARPSPVHRRIVRLFPPLIQTSLIMGILQGGSVLIAGVNRGAAPHFGDLRLAALFYALEAAIGVAAFCGLFALIGLLFSRARRWWLYALGTWAVYGLIDRIQRYATFVPLPWERGSVFRPGLDFGRAGGRNVFINGFPGNAAPEGSPMFGPHPPYANADTLNIWINGSIAVACWAALLIVAVAAAAGRRRRDRSAGAPLGVRKRAEAGGRRRESASDQESLIPWDPDETAPRSRRIGP